MDSRQSTIILLNWCSLAANAYSVNQETVDGIVESPASSAASWLPLWADPVKRLD